MKKALSQNKITIDAQEKPIGRLASKAALLLMDKNNPRFEYYLSGKNVVYIKNIENVKFSGKKLTSKFYYRHSGYPGGFKKIPLERLFREDPKKLFRQIVYGMLPKNKLRDQRIKRLKFIP